MQKAIEKQIVLNFSSFAKYPGSFVVTSFRNYVNAATLLQF